MSTLTEKAPRLVLPTEAEAPSKRYCDQKIVLIGPAGCGKSEFLAQGNALFVDTEGNLKHLRVKRLACRSWDDLREIYILLAEQAARRDQPFPYESVVIDTFDRAALFAGESVLESARIRYPKHAHEINTLPDIGDGRQGWSELAKLINIFLIEFEKLPCAKILVCHEKEHQVELPTKAKFTRYVLNVGGQAGERIWEWANHILHLRPQGGGEIVVPETPLIMRSRPTVDIQAKSHGSEECPGVPDLLAWKLAKDGRRLDALANWQMFRANFTD